MKSKKMSFKKKKEEKEYKLKQQMRNNLLKRKEQIMLNYLSQKIFPTILSKMKYKQNNKVFYLQKKGQELMKKIKDIIYLP